MTDSGNASSQRLSLLLADALKATMLRLRKKSDTLGALLQRQARVSPLESAEMVSVRADCKQGRNALWPRLEALQMAPQGLLTAGHWERLEAARSASQQADTAIYTLNQVVQTDVA